METYKEYMKRKAKEEALKREILKRAERVKRDKKQKQLFFL